MSEKPRKPRQRYRPRLVSPDRICHVCGAEALLGGEDPVCQSHLEARPPQPATAAGLVLAWQKLRKMSIPTDLSAAIDAIIDDEVLRDACALLLAAEDVQRGVSTKAEAAETHGVPLSSFVYAYRRFGRSKRAVCLLHPRSCAYCEDRRPA